MEQDKFTHIFRLPSSIQVRIAKWQQTFRGKSDLVLHQALVTRNRQYKQANFQPKGWCVNLFDPDDISITHHGDYIQTAMRTMVDRKVSYKRIYLSRLPLEQATEELRRFKLTWIKKHNTIAKRFNQLQKETFLNYAREEIETLYPAIPEHTFDRTLWNRIVNQELGSEANYEDPYFVVQKVQTDKNKLKNRPQKSTDKKPHRRFRSKHSDATHIRHP